MSTSKLFEPFKLGSITLPNRFVMAPLTRNRALEGLVPNPLAVEYYGQRASAGLLISEATQVSQQGQGYQDTPDRKSTRLNSSHLARSRMPSSA